MDYITATEMAVKWNITKRRVNILCMQNRVKGAIKKGNIWLLPNNSEKPTDARTKQKGANLYDEIKW